VAVIETTLATEPRKPEEAGWIAAGLERALRATLPAANPDFERLHGSVRKWWVEVDEEGVPQRELGFDQSGRAIVAGPFGENFGFWTDSNMKFTVDEHQPIAAERFEAAWRAFEKR